jgi:hypothetical protein
VNKLKGVKRRKGIPQRLGGEPLHVEQAVVAGAGAGADGVGAGVGTTRVDVSVGVGRGRAGAVTDDLASGTGSGSSGAAHATEQPVRIQGSPVIGPSSFIHPDTTSDPALSPATLLATAAQGVAVRGAGKGSGVRVGAKSSGVSTGRQEAVQPQPKCGLDCFVVLCAGV